AKRQATSEESTAGEGHSEASRTNAPTDAPAPAVKERRTEEKRKSSTAPIDENLADLRRRSAQLRAFREGDLDPNATPPEPFDVRLDSVEAVSLEARRLSLLLSKGADRSEERRV